MGRDLLIPAGSRVLLDTVSLVYFLEPDSPWSGAAGLVMQRIEEGSLAGVISTLLFTELLVPLYRAGEERRAGRLVSTLEGFRNLRVMAVDRGVSMRAASLRARFGLRSPDAIHAATALEAECDGILTNDRGYRRLHETGLEIWLFEQSGRESAD